MNSNINPKPVDISGAAHQTLSRMIRQWSGWKDASLSFSTPNNGVSSVAQCDHVTRAFTVNAERLVLNPNRVIHAVTTFRLKQEAVLTGAMLHEAGHARHTHWKPRTEEAAAAWRHGDGTTVPSQATVALATAAEEARVESMMARDAAKVGAPGLGWTLRATSAMILPITPSDTDPNQWIMDFIGAWILKAGKRIAAARLTQYTDPNGVARVVLWTRPYNDLLRAALFQHCVVKLGQTWVEAKATAGVVEELLYDLICGYSIAEAVADFSAPGVPIKPEDTDTGTWMIDTAKKILDLLFPETDPDDQPMPGGCGGGMTCGETPQNPEPGEGEGAEGESGESGEGEGAEGESGEGEGEGAEGESGEGEGEGAEGESGEGEGISDRARELNELLREVDEDTRADQRRDAQEQRRTEEQEAAAANGGGGEQGGQGSHGTIGKGTVQMPTPEDRMVQKQAERFLRDLVNPTETGQRALTASPAATVDGAALHEWKASGGRREPRFFNRLSRAVAPAPPVKIAILVDTSGSMDVLQKPSALLSWALAAAAYDMRNFAGRGKQVESTLIHWDDSVAVVQPNGEMLPGLVQAPCIMGTTAMGAALAEIEQQIPGFFEITDKPENKLIVQFTDWELASYSGRDQTLDMLKRAGAAGVNMLSVMPDTGYKRGLHILNRIQRDIPIQRGQHTVVTYNPNKPETIWSEASKMLAL